MPDAPVPKIVLSPWDGPWPDDDPDANFKREVALYGKLDPLATIGNVSANLDIPVGALCRYVLAKWSSAGAEALLTLGPTALGRLSDSIERAESVGTDAARLAAYEELRAQLSWLNAGFDDPDAYPA